MSRRGFTLLEMMFTVSIMTVVMGVLFGLSLGMSRA
ncbi:MAG: type II secretion system protein, partial [Geobacteraceae bacterium]|nr:type II secretion system protein [Geobacteraceae bacterium]